MQQTWTRRVSLLADGWPQPAYPGASPARSVAAHHTTRYAPRCCTVLVESLVEPRLAGPRGSRNLLSGATQPYARAPRRRRVLRHCGINNPNCSGTTMILNMLRVLFHCVLPLSLRLWSLLPVDPPLRLSLYNFADLTRDRQRLRHSAFGFGLGRISAQLFDAGSITRLIRSQVASSTTSTSAATATAAASSSLCY
jgi:hypothetical protein